MVLNGHRQSSHRRYAEMLRFDSDGRAEGKGLVAQLTLTLANAGIEEFRSHHRSSVKCRQRCACAVF
jgi:hypothetical protein